MAGPLLPALVKTVGTNFASASSISQSISVTNAGDTLILSVVNRSLTTGLAANATSSTPVSGAGATWYLAATQVGGTSAGCVDIWVGVNASSGSQTVTINFASSQTVGCNLDEWRYLSYSPQVVDLPWSTIPAQGGYGYRTGIAAGSSTSPSSGPLYPDTLGQLIYVATTSVNTQTASPASPWTTEVGPTSSSNQVAGIAYWVTNTLTNETATWTQSAGVWGAAVAIFQAEQPTGDTIWNDPSGTTNNAVLTQQAAPDYLDFVNNSLGLQGTGVLQGCAIGPNTGSDFNWQNGAGTVAFNWGPVLVNTSSANAVTAADATNPRKDVVYVDTSGTLHYQAGTAAATPCAPNVPIFPYVLLGEIDVPANATVLDNGTSTSNAHVTDKRCLITPPPKADDFAVLPNQLAGSTSQAFAETIPRKLVTTNASVLSTGKAILTAIWLPAGLKVGHITFVSATTAAGTPSHWWFGLWDGALDLLCATADQTSTAWAGNTVKNLAIATSIDNPHSATSYVTKMAGLHYLGIMVAATTVPTLQGLSYTNSSVNNQSTGPFSTAAVGQWGTGLTTVPAYGQSGLSLTATTAIPYGWIGE